MKKTECVLAVSVKLPQAYKAKLEAILEDEYVIACKKWGVSPTEEEKLAIMAHSKTQLQNKASSLAKNTWTIEDETLVVNLITTKPGRFEAELPSEKAAEFNITIYRAHDHWRVETEKTKELVAYADFYNHVLETLEQWSRTAVFYGVGSYL